MFYPVSDVVVKVELGDLGSHVELAECQECRKVFQDSAIPGCNYTSVMEGH